MTGETGKHAGTIPPFVGYPLALVAHLLGQRMDRGLSALGVTATGFGVLFQLQHNPEVSSAELARRVLVTPQSAGPLLARLERDGLVVRDQIGGPGTPIISRITERGRQRLAEAMALVQEIDDDLSAGLAPAERAALVQQLWEMLGRLSPAAVARPQSKDDAALH